MVAPVHGVKVTSVYFAFWALQIQYAITLQEANLKARFTGE